MAAMVRVLVMRELIEYPLEEASHEKNSVGERAPGWFADLAVEYRQGLTYAAVDRGHRQHAATVLDGAVKHLHAIGRVAGGLVVRTIRQNLFGTCVQGQACNPESTVSPGNVHQLLTVRRYPGRNIVTAREGQTLGVSACCGDLVDLRAAAPVAGKDQGLAIGGIPGFGVDQRRAHHAAQIGAIGVDGVYLRDAVS